MNSILRNFEHIFRCQGFQTLWHDPFYDWVHTLPFRPESAETTGNALYIINPPIPRIAPFDFSSVMINIGSDSKISFALSIYFRDVLADVLEGYEITSVYSRHDREWHESLRTYFSDIASRFQLIWDIEYDETIEDCLYGSFSLDNIEEIIALMKAIKEASDSWAVKETR
jgi:hypothetical protein